MSAPSLLVSVESVMGECPKERYYAIIKDYEKTDKRGMEKMAEMQKNRKPGEGRAQQLGEPTLQV